MSGQVADPVQVLIVDDEVSIRWVLRQALREAGYTVHEAESAEAARSLLGRHSFQVALVDINLPGEDGLSFTKSSLKMIPDLAVLVMTGQDSMFHTIEAMKAGAYDYIAKPFDLEAVEQLVEKAAQDQRRQPASAKRKQARSGKSDLLVGSSSSMRELYKAIGRVADTDLTVLIQGESGTGKELVARSIHQHSGRAARSFVAINCAAIPSELLESELFGHEKGSFTGAVERKRGKLEIASGGTLFLDEIGDMPLVLQSKLLRVLQEQQFERVGGHQLVSTDLRVIAATHRNLEQRIKDGQFRMDLYYRLNVFPVKIAPLRERPEDIPELIEHILQRGCRELAVSRKEMATETMTVLQRYPWPGNVRELENTVKSLMITNFASVIPLESLPQSFVAPVPSQPVQESLEDLVLSQLRPVVKQYVQQEGQELMDLVMPQVERPLLHLLLEETRWNQQRAARILGINRNTLRKRIENLGLKRQQTYQPPSGVAESAPEALAAAAQ